MPGRLLPRVSARSLWQHSHAVGVGAVALWAASSPQPNCALTAGQLFYGRVCVREEHRAAGRQVVGVGCIPGRHNRTGCSACIRFLDQGFGMLTQRRFVWFLQCLGSPGWLVVAKHFFLCVHETEAGRAGDCCVQVDKLRHIATPCNAAGIQGLTSMIHDVQELCPFTIHAQCLSRSRLPGWLTVTCLRVGWVHAPTAIVACLFVVNWRSSPNFLPCVCWVDGWRCVQGYGWICPLLTQGGWILGCGCGCVLAWHVFVWVRGCVALHQSFPDFAVSSALQSCLPPHVPPLFAASLVCWGSGAVPVWCMCVGCTCEFAWL